jgi:peroxiredoxin
MRHFVVLSSLAMVLGLALQAQGTRMQVDISKRGPQVGERVPDFKLPDQTGNEQTLRSIMGRRGAMLVFVRSADW